MRDSNARALTRRASPQDESSRTTHHLSSTSVHPQAQKSQTTRCVWVRPCVQVRAERSETATRSVDPKGEARGRVIPHDPPLYSLPHYLTTSLPHLQRHPLLINCHITSIPELNLPTKVPQPLITQRIIIRVNSSGVNHRHKKRRRSASLRIFFLRLRVPVPQ